MKDKEKNITKKTQSARMEKARVFFKRYWYWFAVLIALAGGILGWCAGMGYFNAPPIAPLKFDMIELNPFDYYKLSDYVDREKATYSVHDDYSEIISVTDGILYAKKQGSAKITVMAGKRTGEITVEIGPYLVRWVIGVGDEVAKEDVGSLMDNVYDNITIVEYNNTDVFGPDGNEDIFVAKKAGLFSARYYTNNDVPVCAFYVNVKETITDEERIIDKDIKPFMFEKDTFFADESKIVATKKMEIGETETLKLKEFSFSGSGHIYFESSNPKAVIVYQNGLLKVDLPGNTLIAIACIGKTGLLEYRTIKIDVQEKIIDVMLDTEIDARNPGVGEILTYDMLEGMFFSDYVDKYETECGELKHHKEDKKFEAAVATGDKYVYIDGLTASGKRIVRYRMIIEAEASGE